MNTTHGLDVLLAALPILTLLGLLFFRVKPLYAVIGAISVVLLLWFRFPIGVTEALAMSSRLTYVTTNIVFILLGGLILSVFMSDSGAQKSMGVWFENAAQHRDRAILLYGLGLTPFLESTIGWGVSLIVAIPLLLRSGVSPSRAISVGVLGLVVCPWGSLGPGIILTGELGGVDMHALGAAGAIANIPLVYVMAVTIAVVGVGKRMSWVLWCELAIASTVLSAVLIAVNWYLSSMLAGVLASLATIAVFLIFAMFGGAKLKMTREQAASFGPIGLLVVAVLICVTLTSIFDLGDLRLWLTSPGLWMMVAAGSAPFFFRMPLAMTRSGLIRGVKSWVQVSITTLLFIVFGVLLSIAGMSATLAEAAASSGLAFLIALPFIGTLAGYLTASVTSVGTMLTFGVVDASHALGVDPAVALGAQMAGGGGGVGASPARLVLGTSVAQSAAGHAVPIAQGKIILVSITANVVACAIVSIGLLLLH